MPFKSRAQRRKFAEMMVKGEISPETFEEWNRETGSRQLPERVAKAPTKRRKTTRTRTKGRKTTRKRANARTRPRAKKKTRQAK